MKQAALSPAARREVVDIVRWLAADNPLAAKGFRDALNRLLLTLAEQPLAGVCKTNLAASNIRFFPIRGYPYVVVYTPDEHPPLVLRVLHGARDLPDVLRHF